MPSVHRPNDYSRRALLSALALSPLAVAGCASDGSIADEHDGTSASARSTASQSGTGASAAGTTSASESPAASATAMPEAEVTSAHALTALLPTDSLKVDVTNGTLTDVTVTTSGGTQVDGQVSGDTWTPTRNLLPQTSYVATITMTDSASAQHQQTVKFSTISTYIAGYDILYSGYEVGVGMPAIIQFVTDVETQAMRAEVEKHVHVTSSPAQEGSWGWIDNRQLMWRPKNYWQAGSKVTIQADLAGIQTGSNKWVGKDASGGFSVGTSRISYVNIATDQMQVTENGQTVRTIPVTTGKQPAYTTRSGTKVIIERFSKIRMDSTTVDIPANSPDAYNMMVYWAMRITWSGEFLHAAPWSVASQGHANVSHGCTGMSTENAEWLFNRSHAGDVVVFTGSNRPFTPDNGIGVWVYSWPQWQQRSALA